MKKTRRRKPKPGDVAITPKPIRVFLPGRELSVFAGEVSIENELTTDVDGVVRGWLVHKASGLRTVRLQFDGGPAELDTAMFHAGRPAVHPLTITVGDQVVMGFFVLTGFDNICGGPGDLPRSRYYLRTVGQPIFS